MEKFLTKNYKIIVAIIMTIFFVISILNAKNDSATFDEVAHIPAAYSYVTQHDTRLNPEHPPLIKDLAGFPLLFMNLNFDTTADFWTGKLPNLWDEGQWAAGRHLLYEAGNNPDMIIFWARIPIVILSLLFGLFIFKWAKEMTGILGGLFALTLFAFDPNILGHNHYVTTDIGIAAFITFAFYYFLRFIKSPTWKNVFFGGLFLGLLLVSKFSSIVVLPVFGMTLFLYSLAKNNREGENTWKTRLLNLWQYLYKATAAFAVAAIVIWVVYKANNFAMPKEVFDQTIDFFFAAEDTNTKAVVTNKVLHALNESSITRPWANYIFGPAWMFKRVVGGNGAYFLGKVGNGFTAYFPVVFMIKETIPFLFLIVFSLGYYLASLIAIVARMKPSEYWQNFVRFLRIRVVQYSLFTFIILYSYLSITGSLNIGLRHLFPIIPLTYLLVTKKVSDFLRPKDEKTKHGYFVAVAILLSWLIGSTLYNYPSYVSYFNETIGGSKNGYHYVTDSNTDWGQDLKRLDIWINEYNTKCVDSSFPCPVTNKGFLPTPGKKIEKIHVDYFGGGNPQYYLGDKFSPWWESKRPIEEGWYAISTNFLQGSIYDPKKTADESYIWTLNYKPVAMIGNSILIYYVPPQEK